MGENHTLIKYTSKLFPVWPSTILINFNFFGFLFLAFFAMHFSLAELKMDVLRERECKDTLERQLSDERKLRGKSKMQNVISLSPPSTPFGIE